MFLKRSRGFDSISVSKCFCPALDLCKWTSMTTSSRCAAEGRRLRHVRYQRSYR